MALGTFIIHRDGNQTAGNDGHFPSLLTSPPFLDDGALYLPPFAGGQVGFVITAVYRRLLWIGIFLASSVPNGSRFLSPYSLSFLSWICNHTMNFWILAIGIR